MPRIKKGSAGAADAAPTEKPTAAEEPAVEVNPTTPLSENEYTGGWNANNCSDPLDTHPSEDGELMVYAEYREDDAPPMFEEDFPEEATAEEVSEDGGDTEVDHQGPEGEEDDQPEPEPTQEQAPVAAGAVPNHQFVAPPLTGQEHPVFGKRLGDAEFVGKYVDGTPEWHAARAAGIGSSDAACVFDVGFTSAHLLWLEKKGYVEPEDLETNPRMAEILLTGHLREPEIGERFRRRHPQWSVHEGGSWRKAAAPWMLSNPDRLLLNEETGEISILECKTSETGTGYEDGRCPTKYVVQVRHQMHVMGLQYAYLAVMIGNSDYREYYIPADVTKPIVRLFARDNRQEIETICHYGDGLTMEIAQYNFLMSPEPPPMSGHKDIYEHIRQKNPTLERNTEVVIPVDIATRLREGQAKAEEAEHDIQWAKNHIMALLGTKHYAMYNGEKIAQRVGKGDNPPYLKLA